jgi:hypothetical protein
MRARLILCILSLALAPCQTATASCTTSNSRLFEYEPMPFTRPSCASINIDATTFYIAAQNQSLEDFEHAVDPIATDNPLCRLSTLRSHASWHNLVLISHGEDGGIYTEHYISPDSVNAAIDRYISAYALAEPGDIECVGANNDYFLLLTSTGISKVLTPQLDSSALIFGAYCWSFLGSSSWVASPQPDQGRTFVGFSCETNAAGACPIMHTLYSGMGCIGSPPAGPDFSDAWKNVPVVDSCPAEYVGNEANRLNCAKGCAPLADALLTRSAGDSIEWALPSDRGTGSFVVRSFETADDVANPDTVALVSADGSGRYKVRSAGLGEVVDVVYRSSGRSPSFSGLCMRLPAVRASLSAAAVAGVEGSTRSNDRATAARADKVLPPCPACADFVIYATDSTMANHTVNHFRLYDNAHAEQYVVKAIVGSGDPMEARATLQAALGANVDYNAMCDEPCYHHFSNPPTFVIVGDVEMVEPLEHEDDELGTCGDIDAVCWSYYDVTDFNDDLVPECPVQVIPASSVAELDGYLDIAEEWNDGEFVEAGPKVLLMVSDEDPYLPYPRSVPDREAGLRVGELLGGHGYPAWFLFEHETPHSMSERYARGVAAMNAGTRYLWVQGRGTQKVLWTQFLRQVGGGVVGDLTRKQRIVVIGPNCNTADNGGNWVPDYEGWARDLMFHNSPEATRAAAVLGQINSDWDFRHRQFAEDLAGRFATSGASTTMSNLLWDAVRNLDPEDRDYGRGYVCYGGYVMKKGGDLADVAAGSPEPTDAMVRTVRNPSVGEVRLRWRMPSGTTVRLELFDVAGRVVAVVQGDVSDASTHDTVLRGRDGGPLPGGIYFVRASGAGITRQSKVVVVR